MLLGKRLFPYPVLNSDKVLSQYAKSEFNVIYDPVQEEDDYVFKGARYILTNSYLQSLIDAGRAKCVLFVECSSTRFRKIFELRLDPHEIKIPMTKLNDKITVSGYIFATEDIIPFLPNDLDPAYGEFDKFTVEANDVLAIDEFNRIKISYKVEDDNLMASIFTIIGDPAITDSSVRVEVTKTKIRISLPKTAYASYDSIKGVDEYKWIPFAIMLVPALTMAFEKTKEGSEEKPLDDIAFDFDWFTSVQMRYKKIMNRDMTEEDYYQTSSFELAQQLLDMPSTKAIDDSFLLISHGNQE